MDKRTINKILRLILGRFLKKTNNMKYSYGGIQRLKPPYILLGNHTNFFDPFIVSYGIDNHIRFVTSDEYFRNFILRWLLKLVGAIPKAKFVSDSSAVRDIIKLKEKKAVIGIYPEGTRTWDGVTAPILYATSRLIKSLKIPVVTALTAGGYLSYPRWARKRRIGEMFLDIKLLLDAHDIESMKVEDINKEIENALRHNENEWQREHMIKFKGEKLAESLELYLHTCPKCLKIGYLSSSDDIFKCNSCGYMLKYNEYGFFEIVSTDNDLIFDNIGDWGEWQQKHLESYVEQISAKSSVQYDDLKNDTESNLKIIEGTNGSDSNLMIDAKRDTESYLNNNLKNVSGINSKSDLECDLRSDSKSSLNRILDEAEAVMSTGRWRRRSFIKPNKGILSITEGKLKFKGSRREVEFDPKYMLGLVVNHKNTLDFFYNDRKLYRIKFANRNISGHLWVEVLKILKRRRRHIGR